jgi:hypothetical protein
MFIARAMCGLTYVTVTVLCSSCSLQQYLQWWPAALNEAGLSVLILMKGSKIPRIELNTVHLYQHYSLFMHNKLQYTWRGDYCECVRPAQLPVLTWSSSSVPPGTTSTIRSPPWPRRIQQEAVFYPLNVDTNLPWYKEDTYCRRVDLLVQLLIWWMCVGNLHVCTVHQQYQSTFYFPQWCTQL